jgi:hypothetical protein
MQLLYDLLVDKYSRQCEHRKSPEPCDNKEILVETFVNESGLWLVRDVCATCREDALADPIGNFLNKLVLPITTDKVKYDY